MHPPWGPSQVLADLCSAMVSLPDQAIPSTAKEPVSGCCTWGPQTFHTQVVPDTIYHLLLKLSSTRAEAGPLALRHLSWGWSWSWSWSLPPSPAAKTMPLAPLLSPTNTPGACPSPPGPLAARNPASRAHAANSPPSLWVLGSPFQGVGKVNIFFS